MIRNPNNLSSDPPDPPDGEYLYPRTVVKAVENVFDMIGGMVFYDDLPDEIVKAMNDCRQVMADWIRSAEDQGIEPDNDPEEKWTTDDILNREG